MRRDCIDLEHAESEYWVHRRLGACHHRGLWLEGSKGSAQGNAMKQPSYLTPNCQRNWTPFKINCPIIGLFTLTFTTPSLISLSTTKNMVNLILPHVLFFTTFLFFTKTIYAKSHLTITIFYY